MNQELNNCARNTNDVDRLRQLVAGGADLASTNGAPWYHTPLHQACYHGRPLVVAALLELGAYEKSAHLESNACGRPGRGLPAELARGGGHTECVKHMENYKPGAVNVSGRVVAKAPSGAIEFLGLWRDSGDRAMPIRMNVNPGDPNQIHRAFDALVAEMRAAGVTSGILATQSYNQMHWSANPNEVGYKKHGFIGAEAHHATRSSWSRRVHQSEGLRFDGFHGGLDVLGGDWQNAVYRVTLDGAAAPAAATKLDGHYFSFQTGGDPGVVVDRFEARQVGDRVTYYRNGPVGSKSRVNSANAQPMESYEVRGIQLQGPVNGTVMPNGDIMYSHGYTSRKEADSAPANVTNVNSKAPASQRAGVPTTITVSGARTHEGHGHWPNDTWHLQGEHAGKPQWYRQGNPQDFIKWDGARWTLNGMQPKCYFQHRAQTALPPKSGWEAAEMGVSGMPTLTYGDEPADAPSGFWAEYSDIDMCFQGDVEIIRDWRATTTIDELKRVVEQKGYSAVTVGSFGHAALKMFPFQLTKEHCKPASGYSCTIYIYTPPAERAEAGAVDAQVFRPGQRLTWADAEAFAQENAGRLITLDEARAVMQGKALCPGEDQWCAVQGRDWVQVGDRHHHPGKSHNIDCGHYPPWGDDAGNQTYGNPTWNYVALYTTDSASSPVANVKNEPARPPPEPDAAKLVLTTRGAPNELVFDGLNVGSERFLTLRQPPGRALVTTGPDAGPYGPWMVAPLGVGSVANAVTATLDAEGFLSYAHGGAAGKVLDVAHWKYEAGNDVNFVGHVGARSETLKPGGGRSFMLNGDGTLACKHAPHLTLGLSLPDCTLVNSGAAERLVLSNNAMQDLRSGRVTALELASHPGCAIVPKTDDPRRIDEWHISYQHLGVGPASGAMKVRLEGNFLLSAHHSTRDFILDVPFGKLNVHCEGEHGKLPIAAINIERGTNKEPHNAARLFQLNPDNTISPQRAPHLVFGVRGSVLSAPDSTNETDDWVKLPDAVDEYGVPIP